MKWLIETNLGPRSAGAIAFGHWLGRKYEGHDIVAIHVAPQDSATLGHHDYPGTGARRDRARATARASVEHWRGPRVFDDVLVLEDDDPAKVVERVAEQLKFDVLVVGRVGPTDGWSFVNLGRTTRRVLGAMPSPVMVVPPDFDTSGYGDGPIVVGITADDAAASAVWFARRMARVLGLPLQMVHVVPPPQVAPLGTVDPAVGFALASTSQRTASQQGDPRIAAWIREQGLQELALRIEIGDPVERLMAVAADVDATMIACGSHEHSWAAQLLGTSVASRLAAHAKRPTLAVPLGHAPHTAPVMSSELARAEGEGMVDEVAKVSGV